MLRLQVLRWTTAPADRESLVALCAAVDILANSPFTADVFDEFDKEEVVQHNNTICMHLQEHIGVPVAMGKRHSALPYKIHAFLHALHLECHLDSIVTFLQSVISVTTDLGTEHLLADASLDFHQHLKAHSHFTHSGSAHVGEAALNVGGAVARPLGRPEFGEGHLTPHALAVTGILHQLHNTLRDMCEDLPNFNKWFKEPFHALCYWLRNNENRDLFKGVCLTDALGRQMRSQLDSFHGNLAEWRWACIVDTIEAMILIEELLVHFCSSDKLLQGARSRHPREDAGEQLQLGHGSTALRKAESFVTSPAHWAYAHMLLEVSGTVTRIMAWAETCPCHHQLVAAESKHMRKSLYRQCARGGGTQGSVNVASVCDSCPMKSRRLPEIAAGDLQEVLDEALATSSVSVLRRCAGLPEVDRTMVMADMRHGQQLLQYSLQLKLAPAQRLPLVLAGLAHHDGSKAPKCAHQALQQFDPQHQHHRLSNRVLALGGPLHAQVEAFANGDSEQSDLEAYPDLFAVIAALKFIPTAERSVERLHAMGKQALLKAPHHACDFFSMAIRRLQLQRQLDSDPGFLAKMAKTCGMVRSAMRAATSLDLHQHPAVTQHILETGGLDWPRLRDIIYRCDVDSRFQACSYAGVSLRPGGASAVGDGEGSGDAAENGHDSNDGGGENDDDAGDGSGTPGRPRGSCLLTGNYTNPRLLLMSCGHWQLQS